MRTGDAEASCLHLEAPPSAVVVDHVGDTYNARDDRPDGACPREKVGVAEAPPDEGLAKPELIVDFLLLVYHAVCAKLLEHL